MIAKFETGASATQSGTGASNGSGINTILLLLGLAVVGYVVYTEMQKKKENDKTTNDPS